MKLWKLLCFCCGILVCLPVSASEKKIPVFPGDTWQSRRVCNLLHTWIDLLTETFRSYVMCYRIAIDIYPACAIQASRDYTPYPA